MLFYKTSEKANAYVKYIDGDDNEQTLFVDDEE
jgi:hypothetical protein